MSRLKSLPFTSVTAIVEPYNRGHDRYQAYYRNSLAAYCSHQGIAFRESGSRFPGQLRFLTRVRHSARFRTLAGDLGTRAIDGIARLLGAGHGKPEYPVGCYVLDRDGAEIRLCIDSQDSGLVTRPDLLEWCHLYLKTNYWPGRSYPPKVQPMANLNPDVLPHIERLRAARSVDKEWDLLAFFRVWGGADEVEGIEHNLALFETLARVKCRKKLLAFLIAGDIGAAAARLTKAGVPYTTTWMPQSELWRMAARSRLNVVRHGMHQCIPWRLTETLAMGGCPVLDYSATTRWHVPLEENVHYLNLGIPYRPSMAPVFDPGEVVDRVEGWLADRSLIHNIERNTARYFDEHLVPEKLGGYILDRAGVLLQPDHQLQGDPPGQVSGATGN